MYKELWITENEVNAIIMYTKASIQNEGTAPVTIDGRLILNKGDRLNLGKSQTLVTKRLCLVFGDGIKNVLITYKSN